MSRARKFTTFPARLLKDPKMLRLPRATQHLLYHLYAHTHPHGRGSMDEVMLYSIFVPQVFPDYKAHYSKLEKAGFIRTYEVEGGVFYELVGYDEDAPSELLKKRVPCILPKFQTNSRIDLELIQTNSRPIPPLDIDIDIEKNKKRGNPPINPPLGDKVKRIRYSSDFEELWRLYPSGAEKKLSYAAYKKALKKITHQELMELIDANLRLNRKWKEGYVKALHRWLRGDPWDDDLDPSQDPALDNRARALMETHGSKWREFY